jgi:cell division protein FtsQ
MGLEHVRSLRRASLVEVEESEMESAFSAALRLPQLLAPRPLPRLRRPARREVLLALLASAVLGGGFLLFRASSLVAVDQVQISGVRGPESAAVSQALEDAARKMTTMDFSAAELRAAVAQYPVVRSLRVGASFPHRMRIVVQEQLPVARISAAGVHAAVAADGVVLGPALASPSLPDVPVPVVPSVGRRVSGVRLGAYLAVLGAAPAPLLGLVSRIYTGPQGVTVRMANGLLAYFGDGSRPHAKWDSLVTVLTDPTSAGASYVDVRTPERPAAGVASGGVGSAEATGVSASDPTSAALAESLAKAVNGEPGAASTYTQGTASPPSGGGLEPAGGGSEPAQAGSTPSTGMPSTEASSPSATTEAGSEAAPVEGG